MKMCDYKQHFVSMAEAIKATKSGARKQMCGRKLNAYKCRTCGHYHIGGRSRVAPRS